MCSNLEMAKQNALQGLCIGDALSMPCHYYISPMDIKNSYSGWLKGYAVPCLQHPNSQLSVSAIDGSGRKGWHDEAKPIIGHMILHDKLSYWTDAKKRAHYHQGMEAGDNTLNTLVALECIKVMQKMDPDRKMEPRQLRGLVLENYVQFMTSPGTHNDTYAESFHRLFFRDWMALDKQPGSGADLVRFCEERYEKISPETEDYNIPVVSGLVLAIPWVLHYAHSTRDQCVDLAVQFVKLTHPAPSLEVFVEVYSQLLHSVLNGADLKTEVLEILNDEIFGIPRKRRVVEQFSREAKRFEKGSNEQVRFYQEATSILGISPYVQGAMTTVLFLAYEFSEDLQTGLIINTNCGGDNANKGSALGALVAANCANKGIPLPTCLTEGLHSAKDTLQKIIQSTI